MPAKRKGCEGLYLEVDNTKGGENGPETITWTEPGDNWYLLYVFDYSGANTTLVQSEVRSKTNVLQFIHSITGETKPVW